MARFTILSQRPWRFHCQHGWCHGYGKRVHFQCSAGAFSLIHISREAKSHLPGLGFITSSIAFVDDFFLIIKIFLKSPITLLPMYLVLMLEGFWELTLTHIIHIQGECETFYINRFMASYNSTREAWALHLALKEYAANIQVFTNHLSFFCVVS